MKVYIVYEERDEWETYPTILGVFTDKFKAAEYLNSIGYKYLKIGYSQILKEGVDSPLYESKDKMIAFIIPMDLQ